jgi:cell division septal protein FtsQ
MTSFKLMIVVLLVAIACLAYILLTRFFPSEEVFFMGSRAINRALVLDLSIKSNKDYFFT